MALNENERKVLDVIREDPFISQQDLADSIKLSRSAAANIISGLVKKGYLLGKAYVINEDRPVVCIGAANIDNRYIVQDNLRGNTSNNVKVASSLGGGARNVAENLGRLGEHVELISVVGDDDNWERIKEYSKPFMNLSHVKVLEQQSTGNFIEILSKEQELLVGLADMSIYDCLTPELLNKCLTTIQRAKCVVIDLNCPKETIEFLQAFTKRHNVPLVLLTVSTQQMVNLPDRLDGIILVTKHNEAEAKFKKNVQTDQELKEMAQMYMKKGVKEIIISKDSEKVVWGKEGTVRFFENPSPHKSRYEWGQNEAFCGAMIYARLNNRFGDSLTAGIVNGYLTLESLQIVRPNLTAERLKKDMEEIHIPDYERA
ncbi:carbohydrate kinase [Desemzia sp. FAM 23991]|uniref:carbohydrate kinase n=1 Tax=unclassified Desemzia TaxID=2685243 RepID=UPI003884B609